MPLRRLDDLDDATFDVTDVQLVGGTLMLNGHVDERVPGVGLARLPVTLSVSAALSLTVVDEAGAGLLVLESVTVRDDGVVLEGVIPCRVHVETSGPSEVLLDVGDHPRAVRRWGRWQR